MPRFHKHLTVALALFALLGAQVFGLQRGYVCVCTGEAVETQAPHCDDAEGCDHEEEGVPHEHEPLTVKHEAQGKMATAQVQAPVLVAILDLNDILALTETQGSADRAMNHNHPPPGRDVNPPASLLVAECQVLLI
jgi:hypothetical protein